MLWTEAVSGVDRWSVYDWLKDRDGRDGTYCVAWSLPEPEARILVYCPALVAAATRVKADLDGRIDAASAYGDPVPVFAGIAELHAALADLKGAEGGA